MAKKIVGFIKLQVPAGKANPSPPIGPALGQRGLNIMEFCKRFNAKTQDTPGKIIPVVIEVYKDKSFEFVTKTAPATVQLFEAAGIKKGSAQSNRIKPGSVTWDQIKAIAEDKMPDLNAFKLESAMKMIAGSARSIGLEIKGDAPF